MRKRKAESEVMPLAIEDRMIEAVFGFAKGEDASAAAAELSERLHAHPCIEMCMDMFLERHCAPAELGAGGQLEIPTIDLELMQELLVEARDIVAQNGMIGRVNACRHGERCLGLSPQIGGAARASAAPLGIWMSREEFRALMESGVAPMQSRGCVLCEAHEVCRRYIEARLHTGDGRAWGARIHQPFCVPAGEPGGFDRRCCVPFDGEGDDSAGMVAPMLLPLFSMIDNTYSRKDGSRSVDVSRLAHRPQGGQRPPF